MLPLLVALAGCRSASEVEVEVPPPKNVVLVLTDDEPFTMMWANPEINAHLVPDSVVFERAYVTAPLCCPMRASLLSGGWYPMQTGVLTNGFPMGGADAFVDEDTLPTRLQAAGVSTGMFGKYLNDYENGMAPYVPPGWDTWMASEIGDGGYDQNVVVGSSTPDASSEGTLTDTEGEHYTSWLFDRALDFVDEHADGPFFVFLAPNSPHLSGSPATEDDALYADYAPRPASFNEEDVSDKPAWLQDEPPLDGEPLAESDETARTMLRNLASLDRETVAFADALAERGLLDSTLFVYTSDNGYLFGEHRLTLKGLPYEESVRVPLVVRMPGATPRCDERLVAINLDIAATVADTFGLPPTGEGSPLAQALLDPTVATRDHVYLDNYTTGEPVWNGVVTDRYKYVEWATGDTELYDLSADPHEMESLHADPPSDADLASFSAWVDEHRGLAILTETLEDAQEGVPYQAQLAYWGGTEPVTFRLERGRLPPGLTLSETGVLEGMPRAAGEFGFAVVAEDASASPWTGRTQSFSRELTLIVGAAPEMARVTRTSPTTAVLDLPARPGVRITVRATPEPVPEGARRETPSVVAGPDGRARLTLEGLRPDRKWYWVEYEEGVLTQRGHVPAWSAKVGE